MTCEIVTVVDERYEINIYEQPTNVIIEEAVNNIIEVFNPEVLVNVEEKVDYIVEVPVSGLIVSAPQPPVGASFSYNLDGTLSSVARDDGVTLAYTYINGVLSEIFDGIYTKVFSYTNGNLTRIDVV